MIAENVRHIDSDLNMKLKLSTEKFGSAKTNSLCGLRTNEAESQSPFLL